MVVVKAKADKVDAATFSLFAFAALLILYFLGLTDREHLPILFEV